MVKFLLLVTDGFGFSPTSATVTSSLSSLLPLPLPTPPYLLLQTAFVGVSLIVSIEQPV